VFDEFELFYEKKLYTLLIKKCLFLCQIEKIFLRDGEDEVKRVLMLIFILVEFLMMQQIQ